MPGTIAAIVEQYQSTNPIENCTINEAKKFADYVASLGMPYDSLVAIQTNATQTPADEIPVVQLQSMGVGGDDNRLYIFGKTGPTGHNIGLSKALIAGLDGVLSFTKLWADRNPGSSPAEAAAAVLSVPSTAAAITADLNKLKASAGLV